VDYKDIPVSEMVVGDSVHYISTGKPSGHVTRKVQAKTRDSAGNWQIKVVWGADKNETIPASKVLSCKRPADLHAKMQEAAAKEAEFRTKILTGLGLKQP